MSGPIAKRSGAGAARVGRPQVPMATCVLVLVALLIQLVCLEPVPFVSEDWTQMAQMRDVPTLWGALDPSLEPLRPLQHGFFWILAHSGGDPTGTTMPLAAHAFALLLNAGSCACVYALARDAGAPRVGALLAVVIFVVFPNVKTLGWSAAVGSAGRVCFELVALVMLVRQARSPGRWRGALGLGAFVIALTFHESAMLLPVMVAAWIAFVHTGTWREGVGRLRKAARDPWIRVMAVGAVVYGVQLLLRPQRHHELKSLAALPANVVKAATALLPEGVRATIVEGMRGAGEDVFGVVVASALLLAMAAGVAVLLVRSRTARFVVAACVSDLGLAVIGAGFVQRYAYFSSALVAVGVGVWIGRRPGVARGAVVAGLALWWAFDTAHDLRDMRAMDRARHELVGSARAARAAAGDGVEIAIVDPLDMTGSERDVPLFNWGLDFLLEAHGAHGPWLLWRTREFATSTNVERVDPARVEDARRLGTPPILDASRAGAR